MARPRSSLRNIIEYLAVRAIVGAISIAPPPLARALAAGCVTLLDRAVPRLRRVAQGNLSMALPQLSTEERDRVIDGVFASIGRVILVFSRFPKINRANINEWIRYEGYEHVERAFAKGKGVLFATGHLGNWELSAFAFGLMTGPMHVVVRPLDNPLIDRFVEARRGLSGNHVLAKRDSVRAMLAALRRNEAIGMLIDQNASPGVFVDFFGTPASTSPGIIRIAQKTGAAIVPGFALWEPVEGKFVLRFFPEVEADLAHLHKILSDVIRAHPDQWLWIHRRWKTRPR